MEITNTSKVSSQDWWRWLLLPFATFGGSFIGALIMWLMLRVGMMFHGGEVGLDSWYFRYVMPVLLSAVFGFLYASIACNVAPRGKVITGTVMVTILGGITVIGLLNTWTAPHIAIGSQIQMTVGSVATMLAAVLTLVDFNGKKV